MKTVGVIGGFGPEATAKFYLELIEECRRWGLARQPRIFVWNAPVPEKLERDALLNGKNIEKFVPMLVSAAKGLEAAGANFVVLPCNTLHVIAGPIQASLTVPFVSIIDVSIKKLHEAGVQRVGLLGTSVTAQSGMFEAAGREIAFIKPTNHIQRKLNMTVHQFVTTRDPKQLHHALEMATRSFQAKGIRDVLIACTDFHGLCPDMPGIMFHDTLTNLVGITTKILVGTENRM